MSFNIPLSFAKIRHKTKAISIARTHQSIVTVTASPLQCLHQHDRPLEPKGKREMPS